MTLLAAIPRHDLHLWCACGHRGQVAVAALLERGAHGWTVQDVVGRARCAVCRTRRITAVRIVFAGESHRALAMGMPPHRTPRPSSAQDDHSWPDGEP